jgi:colanic acid biosynthesis glycosyl transferase WcaI
MTRILILSLTFSPDNVSTAHIMSGIAEDLKAYGHQVCVITTTPHYHRDPNLEKEQPLRNRFFGFVKTSQFKGIPVYHISMPDKQSSKLIRIASWLSFHLVSTIIGSCIRFKPDVILAPSPPLSIGVNACAIAWLTRAKYIYNVQELYPDIAVNLGVISQKGLIRVLAAVERFIYNHSAAVTSITESIHEKVAARINDPRKARLIPNFVDLADVAEAPRINAFSQQYRTADHFVVTYAGNVGVPQNLSILVEAGRLLQDDKDIMILIIGDGSKKEDLERQIRHDGMTNVHVIDYQPLSMMPLIYASSDVFYVGQTLDAHSDGIPSKIYRIMANRKPILAVTTPDSDLARCLRASGAGVAVSSDDPVDLARAIRDLRSRRCDLYAYGQKAYEYVLASFERRSVSRQYERLIGDICCKTPEREKRP